MAEMLFSIPAELFSGYVEYFWLYHCFGKHHWDHSWSAGKQTKTLLNHNLGSVFNNDSVSDNSSYLLAICPSLSISSTWASWSCSEQPAWSSYWDKATRSGFSFGPSSSPSKLFHTFASSSPCSSSSTPSLACRSESQTPQQKLCPCRCRYPAHPVFLPVCSGVWEHQAERQDAH